MPLQVMLQTIHDAKEYLLTYNIIVLNMIAGAAKTWFVHLIFGDDLLDLSPTNSLVKEKQSKYNPELCRTLHSVFENIPTEMKFMTDFDFDIEINGKSIFDYVIFIDEVYMLPVYDSFVRFLDECKRRGTKVILAGDSAQYVGDSRMDEYLRSVCDCYLECNHSYRAGSDTELKLYQELRQAALTKNEYMLPSEVPIKHLTTQDLFDHKHERWITSSNQHELLLYSVITEGCTEGMPLAKEGRYEISVPYIAQEAHKQTAFSQISAVCSVKRAQGLDLDEQLNILISWSPMRPIKPAFAQLMYVALSRNKWLNNNTLWYTHPIPEPKMAPIYDMDMQILQGKEYTKVEGKNEIIVSRVVKQQIDRVFRKITAESDYRKYYTIGGNFVKTESTKGKIERTLGRTIAPFWPAILYGKDILPVISLLGNYRCIHFSLGSTGDTVFSIDANQSHCQILAQNQIPLVYTTSTEPFEGATRLVYVKGKYSRMTFEGLVFDTENIISKLDITESVDVLWVKMGWVDGHKDVRTAIMNIPAKLKGIHWGTISNLGVETGKNGQQYITQSWSGYMLWILIQTVYFQRAVKFLDTFGDNLVSITVDAYNFGLCDIEHVIGKVNEILPTFSYKCLNKLIFNQVIKQLADDDKAKTKATNKSRVCYSLAKYKPIYTAEIEMYRSKIEQKLVGITSQREAAIFLGIETDTPEEFLVRYGVERYQELPAGKRQLYAQKFGLPDGVISSQEIGRQKAANFNLQFDRHHKYYNRMSREEIESKFHVVKTAAELVGLLGNCKLVVFDTETYEQYNKENRPDNVVAQWVKGSWQDTPFSLSLCNGEACYVLYGTDEISKLVEFFAAPDTTFVAHNAKFDRHLLENIGIKIAGKMLDTQIMYKLIDENKPHAKLEDLVKVCLNDYQWASAELDAYKKTNKPASYKDIPEELMTPYTCGDVWNCYQLLEWCTDNIKHRELEPLLAQEMEVEGIVYKMSRHGYLVNTEAVQAALTESSKILEELTAKLYELNGGIFNINSHQQLRAALLKHSPAYPIVAGYTPAGALQTSKDAVEACLQAEPDNEFLQVYLSIKALDKAEGAYLPNFLKFADKNGYMHPTINTTEARTGRMSISNPALQQIPKDIRGKDGEVLLSLRSFFKVPDGFTLVTCDLDQIEYRLLAINSGCIDLIDKINLGYDVHSATAATLSGHDIEYIMANKETDKEIKQLRAAAKTVNFAIVYGQGNVALAQALSHTSVPTSEQITAAESMKQKYFNSMPEIEQFISRVGTEFEQTGKIRNHYGRYRNKTAKDGAYKAVNALIQGEAADYFKSRMVAIDRWIAAERLQDVVKMVLCIHDELHFYVRNDRLDLIPNIQALMCDKETFMADLTADCSISHTTWANKKSFKGGSL